MQTADYGDGASYPAPSRQNKREGLKALTWAHLKRKIKYAKTAHEAVYKSFAVLKTPSIRILKKPEYRGA